MKKKEMTAQELEALIKQKTEIDNKQALNALKEKQREEIKDLRARLANAKRQEKARLANDVGEEFMSVFSNKNMTFVQYKEWIHKFVECWNSTHPKEQKSEATNVQK